MLILLSITPQGMKTVPTDEVPSSVRLHTESVDTRARIGRVKARVMPGDMGLTELPKVGDGRGDVPFTPLWGTDILIRNANNGTPSGLAMDVSDDGDIFVAALMKGPGYRDDTLEIWMSTDGGRTWSRNTYMDVYGEIDYQGMDLAVGPGSNPWLYVVVNWDDSSTGTVGQGLYLRRLRVDGSAWDWLGIVEGDTVDRPRISINGDGTLALTYITDNGKVYRGVSTDSASTWDLRYANLNTTWAEIYISDNGRGYHAYVMSDTNVVVVTFDAPSALADDVTVLELPDTARQVSITASGGTASSQEAVVVWANRHPSTDVWDVHYSYSTNGGATWSTPDVFPPTNFAYPSGDFMNYPYVHRDRNSTSFRFVSTFVSAWDTVFYAHSSAADGWSSSILAVNDHNATTSFGAVVDYCPGTSGGCVTYREYASDNVWFDGWNLTEVSEVPRAAEGSLRVVRGGIETPGRASIYSTDGRLVAEGSGFLSLRRGLYLVRFRGKTYRVIVR